jgi:hypothetical protein
VLPIALDHPRLVVGWWQPEQHGPNTLRRWTNGDATLALADTGSAGREACLLEVEIAATLAYKLPIAYTWDCRAATEAAA